MASVYKFLEPVALKEGFRAASHHFSCGERLELHGGDLFFEVQPLIGHPKTGVEIDFIGTEWFHSQTAYETTADGLRVVVPRRADAADGSPIDGWMLLRVSGIPHLHITCDGRGQGRVNLPMQRLVMRSGGALNLKCGHISDTNLCLDGNSSVSIERVTEACAVEINGAARAKIVAGEFSLLQATVAGTGRLNAYVTVEEAALLVRDGGAITVGHITGNLNCNTTQPGKIHVLRRG